MNGTAYSAVITINTSIDIGFIRLFMGG
jgi:hypothetical protein